MNLGFKRFKNQLTSKNERSYSKNKKLCLLLIVAITVFFLILLNKRGYYANDEKHPKNYDNIIVWWKPLQGYNEDSYTKYCGIYKCTFMSSRQDWQQAKALLFYGSALSTVDFPLPRKSGQIWALLHEESPRNVPYASDERFLKYFNFTSTLSRYSDYPLTTLYLQENLTSHQYMVAVGEKTRLQRTENLAPIVFLNSDCDTASDRDNYVSELMKYIKIDSYGACLHNRDLPKSLKDNYLNKLYSPELLKFLSRYKFVLAYENGVCNDYISEKFWRPLIVGSIPVYFGSPTIKDWQPNELSVVHIRDFSDPKDLATFLEALNKNDTAYNEYLQHKYNQLTPITNQQLHQTLLMRDYAPSVKPNLVELFECFACQKINEIMPATRSTATLSHYDCPFPPNVPPMQSVRDGHHSENYRTWKSIMSMGKCQAQILDELWTQNEVYTKKDFDDLQRQKVLSGACD